jgi:hypothetical protein
MNIILLLYICNGFWKGEGMRGGSGRKAGRTLVILVHCSPEPVFVNLFKEPRNRFPAWRPGTTTLFVVPACHATLVGEIKSLESIPGLLKRLQIRAQAFPHLSACLVDILQVGTELVYLESSKCALYDSMKKEKKEGTCTQ